MPVGTHSAPLSPALARERLQGISIPPAILDVLRRLDGAGHHGVVVGGAVRDALLGRDEGDWDVASNATPEQVIALFARTIPTGLEHGTVTVMSGRGDQRHAVEITTFRGEGAYEDGRRPSEVRFLEDLEEDLARRDLTINAFAWDPINAVFTDAFGGLDDLREGLIRAVGDPRRRFAEDGLRTMRAVRFAATMGFRLAAETREAIAGALEVFAKVSGERVHVELFKLLRAPQPSLGLRPMIETGLWDVVLLPVSESARDEALAAVDRLPARPLLRLARLLRPAGVERARVEAVVEALKPSRDERARLLQLCGPTVDSLEQALTRDGDEHDPSEVRRAVAKLGRAYLEDGIALLELGPALRATLDADLEGAALTGKELAIKGRDLIAAGVCAPGPALGVTLAALLEWVLDDPSRNRAEALVDHARGLS